MSKQRPCRTVAIVGSEYKSATERVSLCLTRSVRLYPQDYSSDYCSRTNAILGQDLQAAWPSLGLLRTPKVAWTVCAMYDTSEGPDAQPRRPGPFNDSGNAIPWVPRSSECRWPVCVIFQDGCMVHWWNKS